MKIKVYRLLASRMKEFPTGPDTLWDIPQETTIIPSMVTDIFCVNREYAIIVYNGFRYKIYREDFDKIFEVEVL